MVPAMGFSWRLLFLTAVLLSGCVAPDHERLRLLNDDGIQQFSRGHYREAAESFSMCLELKPSDPVLLYNLAQCYDRQGDWQRGEQYYRECLTHAPRHVDARQGYVTLLYRTGRAAEANMIIGHWMAETNAPADAFVLDAWRLRQERNYPQAQVRLQEALALEPHNSRALTELGIWYEQMNMPERSIVLYERVLEKDPDQFEVRDRLTSLKGKGLKPPLPN